MYEITFFLKNLYNKAEIQKPLKRQRKDILLDVEKLFDSKRAFKDFQIFLLLNTFLDSNFFWSKKIHKF